MLDCISACISLPNRTSPRPVPPPPKQESFYGCQLAALNGLALEARCAIKARQAAALGPPVNLLVKVRAARKSRNERKKNELKRGAALGTQPAPDAAGQLQQRLAAFCC